MPAKKFETALIITGDGSGGSRAIKLTREQLEKLSKTGKTSQQNLQGVNTQLASMKSRLGALGPLIGVFSLAGVGYGLTRMFTGAVEESEKLERNLLRTERLIVSTGGAAGKTAKQLHEDARQLALATLESTEGVMAAQQIMLTFKSVTGDTFTRATELAADLATVTGVDLKSSVTQLGKALEDPVKGINAMTRSGVSFTEQQKEMIKSLVATGQKAEAQTLILDELATQYGGVARNEAKGFAGVQDTLKQSFQELKQAVGGLILEGGGLTSFYQGLSSIALFLTDNITEVTAGLTVLTALIAAKFVPAIIVAGSKIALAFALTPIGVFSVAVAGATALFINFKDDIVSFGDTSATVGDYVVATWEYIKESISSVIDNLREWWGTFNDDVSSSESMEQAGKNALSFSDVLKGTINFSIALWRTLTDAIKTVWNSMPLYFEVIGLKIQKAWTTLAKNTEGAFRGMAKGVATMFSDVTSSIAEGLGKTSMSLLRNNIAGASMVSKAASAIALSGVNALNAATDSAAQSAAEYSADQFILSKKIEKTNDVIDVQKQKLDAMVFDNFGKDYVGETLDGITKLIGKKAETRAFMREFAADIEEMGGNMHNANIALESASGTIDKPLKPAIKATTAEAKKLAKHSKELAKITFDVGGAAQKAGLEFNQGAEFLAELTDEQKEAKRIGQIYEDTLKDINQRIEYQNILNHQGVDAARLYTLGLEELSKENAKIILQKEKLLESTQAETLAYGNLEDALGSYIKTGLEGFIDLGNGIDKVTSSIFNLMKGQGSLSDIGTQFSKMINPFTDAKGNTSLLGSLGNAYNAGSSFVGALGGSKTTQNLTSAASLLSGGNPIVMAITAVASEILNFGPKLRIKLDQSITDIENGITDYDGAASSQRGRDSVLGNFGVNHRSTQVASAGEAWNDALQQRLDIMLSVDEMFIDIIAQSQSQIDSVKADIGTIEIQSGGDLEEFAVDRMNAILGGMTQGLSNYVTNASDEYAGQVAALEKVSAAYEISGQLMSDLGITIKATNVVVARLPEIFGGDLVVSLDDAKDKAALATLSLVELAGGLDNLLAANANYMEQIYTDEQKFDYVLKQHQESLSDFYAVTGAKSVESASDLYNYVEALKASGDIATEQGQKNLLAAYDVADAFAYFRDQLADVENATEDGVASQTSYADAVTDVVYATEDAIVRIADLVDQLYSDPSTTSVISEQISAQNTLISGIKEQQSAEEQRISALNSAQQSVYNTSLSAWNAQQSLAESTRAYLDDMLLDSNLTTLTPHEQLLEAQTAFNNAVSANDLESAQSVANELLSLSRGALGSTEAYSTVFNSTRSALDSLASSIESQHAPTETADIGSVVSSQLDSQLTTAQAQLNVLQSQLAVAEAAIISEDRRLLAVELATEIGALGLATNTSIYDLLESNNINIDELATDFGIDLTQLDHTFLTSIETLADVLHTDSLTLADKMGVSIDAMGDLVASDIRAQTASLPADIQTQLATNLTAIENANDAVSLKNEIVNLQSITGVLPSNIQSELDEQLSNLVGIKNAGRTSAEYEFYGFHNLVHIKQMIKAQNESAGLASEYDWQGQTVPTFAKGTDYLDIRAHDGERIIPAASNDLITSYFANKMYKNEGSDNSDVVTELKETRKVLEKQNTKIEALNTKIANLESYAKEAGEQRDYQLDATKEADKNNTTNKHFATQNKQAVA